eukprot:CAMPEP_0197823820 /NCGR_PEP_ID=MMETSP1437-20131217/1135_1 /TAXON_ID=49252 ORGANISM="Eucampia antarctica, Strain CCMP1452" /NCGR_SAMPLE_ID=MMETSP1437 /ASSEMBLY_ACC=CAM_ASM_001096 /LENGTH=185 /DNA_ID=CAMNT_0043423175 /DNA_START=30 /DNA_END=590 /DNA_ORIENTATION=-
MSISDYKVGVILNLEGCGNCKSKGGKALKACKVNIGDEENPIIVVTSASNVRTGSRVVIAPTGSKFIDDEGTEQAVTNATVGGVVSQGMFCDSRMLGWSGGGKGVAVQVPDICEIGSAPPSSKPNMLQEEPAAPEPVVEVKGLYDKKLSKEEKKKLAEERRKAKKAAKAAKANNDGATDNIEVEQ